VRHARFLFIFIGVITLPCLVLAKGLEATLDQYEITIPADHPTALAVTLKNTTTGPLYFTGIEVSLTEGASGDVYDPTLLQEKLHKLDAGQSWDGPLALVKPKHRGPLLVKGAILIKGGNAPDAQTLLASIPVYVTINDPRRQLDGSYDHEAVPACDRDWDSCCDPLEALCFQVGKRCFYVADGYDRQQFCINGKADKSYEQIKELQVSSDGVHAAYLAFSHCLSGGPEERCTRSLVLDHVEQSLPNVPTHLALSPDGLHYAYIGRKMCVTRAGEESCTGPSVSMVDGQKVTTPPAWALQI
jgi:hypothetical protein